RRVRSGLCAPYSELRNSVIRKKATLRTRHAQQKNGPAPADRDRAYGKKLMLGLPVASAAAAGGVASAASAGGPGAAATAASGSTVARGGTGRRTVARSRTRRRAIARGRPGRRAVTRRIVVPGRRRVVVPWRGVRRIAVPGRIIRRRIRPLRVAVARRPEALDSALTLRRPGVLHRRQT